MEHGQSTWGRERKRAYSIPQGGVEGREWPDRVKEISERVRRHTIEALGVRAQLRYNESAECKIQLGTLGMNGNSAAPKGTAMNHFRGFNC